METSPRVSADRDWTAALSSGGATQDLALRDLRKLLILGLRRSFSQQGDAFVEDTAQVALIQILKSLKSFAGKSRFSTWAVAIAVRLALSELRKGRWRHVSLSEMADSRETEELVEKSIADPSRINSQNCIKERLRELVDSVLTDKQRTAILAELNGVPLEEIAIKQGASLNATYKLLHDARKRLKNALEKSSIFQEDVTQEFSV